jgi:Uma2 family endonuclease
MGAAKKLKLMSVEDYLAGELRSSVKHEYLGGVIHAMAGATNNHNTIAGNVFATLHARLRGKRCRPFNSDTKVRVRLASQTRFYYPDVSVVCHPNPPEDSFQDAPAVVVEVLSRATRRTDMGEKKDAYFKIPTLSVYVLVEQDEQLAIVFRRTNDGFVSEVYEGLDSIIPLSEVETELALRDAYEDVTFMPEPNDDDSENVWPQPGSS